MGQINLVSGGCRSGKSSFAVTRSQAYQQRFYLATAQSLDQEMAERIDHHKAERCGQFVTIEEPINVLAKLKNSTIEGVLVFDCITLWLSNLVFADLSDKVIRERVKELTDYLTTAPFDSYLVTNEVGQGIVPEAAISRRFRDLADWVNQDIARVSDEVWLVSLGLPLPLKQINKDYQLGS